MGRCGENSATPRALLLDLVHNDPERIREPADNPIGFRELRVRLGWPNVTKESLRDVMRTLPGRLLAVDVVYVEDIYETVAGDGYFSYPQRGYFSRAAAERAAAWITGEVTVRNRTSTGFRGVAKRFEAILDDDDQVRVPRPRGRKCLIGRSRACRN